MAEPLVREAHHAGTAVHESWHAVSMFHYGIAIDYVAIARTKSANALGECAPITHLPDDPNEWKSVLIAHLIAALVGYIATPEFLPAGKSWPPSFADAATEPLDRIGDTMDMLLTRFELTEMEYRAACREAAWLVLDPTHRDEAGKVSDMLLTECMGGRLTGAQVAALLRPYYPR